MINWVFHFSKIHTWCNLHPLTPVTSAGLYKNLIRGIIITPSMLVHSRFHEAPQTLNMRHSAICRPSRLLSQALQSKKPSAKLTFIPMMQCTLQSGARLDSLSLCHYQQLKLPLFFFPLQRKSELEGNKSSHAGRLLVCIRCISSH